MNRKKIAAICLSLALCAGTGMTLTGCGSEDDKRPQGPPPGAVSGGAAGFPGAPPDGERPEGTPPADFQPGDGDFQPPEGAPQPGDGDFQPPEGAPQPGDGDFQPPEKNNS